VQLVAGEILSASVDRFLIAGIDWTFQHQDILSARLFWEGESAQVQKQNQNAESNLKPDSSKDYAKQRT